MPGTFHVRGSGWVGPRRSSSLRSAVLHVSAALILVAHGASPMAQVPLEADLKAALIYKLVRFVEWPDSVPQSPAPLAVCVADNESVRAALVAWQGRQPRGDRPVTVRVFDPARPDTCHVVFVGAASGQLNPILRAVAAKPVLTIGESAGFADQGGMVNLVRDGRHLRLEVNRDAVARGSLVISALVLSLARTVFR